MNKVILFLLGISLLTAGEISSMDTATFNSLVELYTNEELTKQQLLDAYDQLGENEALEAQTLLEELGTPVDELKVAALAEQELYTRTFDTLVQMYKDQEISRGQLIKAYNLFETDEDKFLGDQALNVLLNKSIDLLRQEEAQAPQVAPAHPRRVQPRRPAPQRRNPRSRVIRHRQEPARNQVAQRAQRFQAPAIQAVPARRPNQYRQDPLESHFQGIRERNQRRNFQRQQHLAHVRAEEEYNRVIRESSPEYQELQEAIRRSQEENRPGNHPLGNPPAGSSPAGFAPVRNQPREEHDGERQAYITSILDQNLAYQAEQERVRQGQGGAGIAPVVQEAHVPQVPQQRINPPVLRAQREHAQDVPAQVAPLRTMSTPVKNDNNRPSPSFDQSFEELLRQAQDDAEESRSNSNPELAGSTQEEQKAAPQKKEAKKASQERKEQVQKPVPPKPARRLKPEEEQAEDQPFEEQVKAARAKRQEAQARKLSTLQKDDTKASTPSLKKSHDKEERALSFGGNRLTKKEPAAQKTVRFDLPQEDSNAIFQTASADLSLPAQTQESSKLEEARNNAQPSQENISVHLGAGSGTPVFQRGNTMLNPKIAEAFNQAIAGTDAAIITQWGHQLAQFSANDTDRIKLLKPIFEALNKANAPREKLELLAQETFELMQEEKQNELTSLVAMF